MKTCWTALSLAALFTLAACKVSQPGDLHTAVAREVKQVTVGGKDWKNPTPDDEATVKAGGRHFQHHCQVCHGLDGQNTGVPFAKNMDPPVEELTSKDVQEYTDGQLKWIIQNGIAPSGMPAWKDILDDEEMWQMVRYIRHLPPKGSLGVPDVYKEEAEQHEHGGEKTEKSGKSHTHKDGKQHKH
ncbi:MAG: cytochrome c [Acidobacteria bacterium]|nr:cytochrome c [Acidobacteriota bacterium]